MMNLSQRCHVSRGGQATRREEIECIRTMGVCRKMPIAKCPKRIGGRPISIRWVNVNKGDRDHPKVGSTLVAQELNQGGKLPDLFAATPRVE